VRRIFIAIQRLCLTRMIKVLLAMYTVIMNGETFRKFWIFCGTKNQYGYGMLEEVGK